MFSSGHVNNKNYSGNMKPENTVLRINVIDFLCKLPWPMS